MDKDRNRMIAQSLSKNLLALMDDDDKQETFLRQALKEAKDGKYSSLGGFLWRRGELTILFATDDNQHKNGRYLQELAISI